MRVTIKTEVKNFFRQRLEILKSFPPYNVLQKRELDTLGLLQYHYYINKDVEINKRHKLVFDYDTMLAIREELGLSEASLNNSKLILRNNKFMDKKSLAPFLIIDPANEASKEVFFTFNINDI